MRKSILSKTMCVLLSAAVIGTSFTPINAAAKASLVTKKVTLKQGQKKTIVIKNKKKKTTYTFKSSSPKFASVSKKGIISAKKAGKASITVKEISKKSKRKLGVVKVTVTKPTNSTVSQTSSSPSPAATASPAAATNAPNNVTGTNAPIITTPTSTQTPAVTDAPKATRTPLVIADPTTPDGFDQAQKDVEYGTLSKITYHSETTGTDRKANIILPAGYSQDKKYPVLYLFHGGNGDEDDWLDGKPQYILGNLIAEGVTPEMIVVMPNCRARENDSKNPSDSLSNEHMDAWTNFLYDFTNDLMPYIEKNYPVLTGRENTAIAGLSMGGRTALYLGFTVPEKTAYIGAFSPAPGIFEYENMGLHEDGYFTHDTFKLPEQYMDNTTLLMCCGSEDGMVGKFDEEYENVLNANNVSHCYYTTPGQHEMKVWANGLYNFAKIIYK